MENQEEHFATLLKKEKTLRKIMKNYPTCMVFKLQYFQDFTADDDVKSSYQNFETIAK